MGWEYHNRQRTPRGTWARSDRTERMQIRCTPLEREMIRGRAYARHMDMTEYLLSLVQRDTIRERYGIDVDYTRKRVARCESTVGACGRIVEPSS